MPPKKRSYVENDSVSKKIKQDPDDLRKDNEQLLKQCNKLAIELHDANVKLQDEMRENKLLRKDNKALIKRSSNYYNALVKAQIQNQNWQKLLDEWTGRLEDGMELLQEKADKINNFDY